MTGRPYFQWSLNGRRSAGDQRDEIDSTSRISSDRLTSPQLPIAACVVIVIHAVDVAAAAAAAAAAATRTADAASSSTTTLSASAVGQQQWCGLTYDTGRIFCVHPRSCRCGGEGACLCMFVCMYVLSKTYVTPLKKC
jgi:hypothetical protein